MSANVVRSANVGPPKLSLIVATIGRAEQLRRLFTSLVAECSQDFEVLVVDQDPQARYELKQLVKQAQLGVAGEPPHATDAPSMSWEPALPRAENSGRPRFETLVLSSRPPRETRRRRPLPWPGRATPGRILEERNRPFPITDSLACPPSASIRVPAHRRRIDAPGKALRAAPA